VSTRDFQKDDIVLDKYRIVRKLGAGGMGTVYLIQHTLLGDRQFVLKVLHSKYADKPDVIGVFFDEAKTLGKLRHQNIVSIVDVGTIPMKSGSPLPFLVMEYLPGMTLQAVISKTPKGMGFVEVVQIGIEIADALDYMHTKIGIIHRDLKPGNVFLAKIGEHSEHGPVVEGHRTRTKLFDFNIAHRLTEVNTPSDDEHPIGTYRYMSPEQWEPRTYGAITPKTDLYALGLLLYEMISGADPFHDCGKEPALREAHLRRCPQSLQWFKSMPPGLLWLIEGTNDDPKGLENSRLPFLLAKQPKNRPQGAFYVGHALREVLKDLRPQPHDVRSIDALDNTEPPSVETAMNIAEASTEHEADHKSGSSRKTKPASPQAQGQHKTEECDFFPPVEGPEPEVINITAPLAPAAEPAPAPNPALAPTNTYRPVAASPPRAGTEIVAPQRSTLKIEGAPPPPPPPEETPRYCLEAHDLSTRYGWTVAQAQQLLEELARKHGWSPSEAKDRVIARADERGFKRFDQPETTSNLGALAGTTKAAAALPSRGRAVAAAAIGIGVAAIAAVVVLLARPQSPPYSAPLTGRPVASIGPPPAVSNPNPTATATPTPTPALAASASPSSSASTSPVQIPVSARPPRSMPKPKPTTPSAGF
jgi:serine/threonine protein kinase